MTVFAVTYRNGEETLVDATDVREALAMTSNGGQRPCAVELYAVRRTFDVTVKASGEAPERVLTVTLRVVASVTQIQEALLADGEFESEDEAMEFLPSPGEFEDLAKRTALARAVAYVAERTYLTVDRIEHRPERDSFEF